MPNYKCRAVFMAAVGALSSARPAAAHAQGPQPAPAETNATHSAGGTRQRPVRVLVGVGPSVFSGLEGEPVGLQGSVAAEYRRGASPLAVRAELGVHAFRTQDLYPCIAPGPSGCYDTSRRSTTALGAAASYRLLGGARARPAVYAIAGAGVYASRRVAIRYPDCAPDRVCASGAADRAVATETDVGVNLGAGVDFAARGWPVFAELRYHRVRPGGGSVGGRDRRFETYEILPFTIGYRF